MNFLLIPVLLIALTNQPAGQNFYAQPASSVLEVKKLDKRAEILAQYFASYGSPLQYHAQDFIEAADKYNVDWKLVPSIAGVESTFGKFVPGGTDPDFTSYNAWGWGVYGSQSLGFKSWKEGIYTVTEGLRKGYLDYGLTNPYTMNKKYAASPSWGWKVDYFMRDLDRFAQSKGINSPDQPTTVLDKTAGASAKLSFQ